MRTSDEASAAARPLLGMGVVLGEYDLVSVPLDAAAVDGLAILITRVEGVTRTETVIQPYAVERVEDPTLTRGREVVSTVGRPGTTVVTYLSYESGGIELGLYQPRHPTAAQPS